MAISVPGSMAFRRRCAPASGEVWKLWFIRRRGLFSACVETWSNSLLSMSCMCDVFVVL